MTNPTHPLLAEMRALGRAKGNDLRPAPRAASFRATVGQPMTLRRAAAFAAVLDALPVYIYHNDRLAGSMRGAFDAAAPAPSDDDKRLLAEVGERGFGTHADHVIIDYPRLLRLGFAGIEAEIAARLATPLTPDQRTELEAMALALAAARRFVDRHAAECARLLPAAPPDQRLRLQQMAEQCARIAQGPPRTFADAVQLVWFVHLFFYIEGRGANGFGRIDQYLLPFFEASRTAGGADPAAAEAAALELITHLWAKIGERSFWLFGDDIANITIGGVTPEGADATNALSYLCLAATRALQIPGPNLSARFHRATPDRFYDACIETIATGVGYPACFNDDVIIEGLTQIGYPLAEARDYAPVGCIETFLPGLQPPWADSRFNLPKALELTLGNGRDLRTGELCGLETGDPEKFPDFDALRHALQAQIVHMVQRHAERFRQINARLAPDQFTSPFLSALMTDCVARGRDINNGGTRYPSNHGVAGMGIGTIADSLAALRRGVFEEKRFTMAQLVAALRADFEGHEDLHRWVWNRAPKFGNDDPDTDALAAWVVDVFCDATLAERTYDGGRFLPLIAANVSNIHAGKETAATPDGRRAGAPLSDAASPTYGQDRQGPTAVVQSMTRPAWHKVVGGSVLNQKYHAAALANPANRAKLAGLLKVFFAQGGQEMQFNVVRAEDLRRALAHPEEHAHLVVRVSGFSARFVSLPKEVQQDILARTTHETL